jgi:predicted  nucleic acid-binding Zn-ribbon protein
MNVLEIFLNLNRKDSVLATLRARRTRIEREFNEKVTEARELERVMRRTIGAHEELERKIRAEERAVAEESQRLVDRRKALSSFTNYKVVQSAEREIEGSARELRLREEGLLKGMEDLEVSARGRRASEEAFSAAKKMLEGLATVGRETIASIDAEIAIVDRDRAAVFNTLPEDARREYEKVVRKYPGDPVSEIEGGVCSGCRMSVGPQAILSVRRGSITRCAGCSRILYAPSGEPTISPDS